MNIPKILIFTRFLFAPIILLLAWKLGDSSRIYILSLMYIGFIGDIFDGIIARKQNISGEMLRRMDSTVDLIFWLSIGVSTWILFPDLIAENKIPIITIIILEAMCYIVSIIKFGKEICTHAFLSKMWGISLIAAFTSLIGFAILINNN